MHVDLMFALTTAMTHTGTQGFKTWPFSQAEVDRAKWQKFSKYRAFRVEDPSA